MSFQPNSDQPATLVESVLPETPTPATYPTVEASRPRLSSRRKLWRDVIEIVLLVVTIYTAVNLATARAIVEGNSMQPNFATGQLVIVNRFAYFFSNPQRGDVVVLHNPDVTCKDVIQSRSVISLPFINPDTNAGRCEDLIKRVIGRPNEHVDIRNGRVYINGAMIDEPYVKEYCTSCNGNWQLKDDQYFVMGDNRNNSYDSHSFGPINRDLLVGQAWVRYWPIDVVQIIPHPRYTEIPKTYIPSPTPTPTATPTVDPNAEPTSAPENNRPPLIPNPKSAPRA